MTAEVAILNKSTIALAADSAMTISRGTSDGKTYNVNKLFSLSKYHPVAVMVYGDAELMSVPWETIVKQYRHALGEYCFDTLEEYALDFLQFIESFSGLFPDHHQRGAAQFACKSYFEFMKKQIDDAVKEAAETESELTTRAIKVIARRIIQRCDGELKQRSRLPNLPAQFASQTRRYYRKEISKAIETVFPKSFLTELNLRRLASVAGNVLSKDIFPMGVSGVVIAGFGDAESFPSVKP